MSFWRNEYLTMLQDIQSEKKKIGSVSDFLCASNKEGWLILRHDVDRRPEKSCVLAELEHQHGVRSTYYFRVSRSGKFPSIAIEHIAGLGHEIGYHYEDLSTAKGDVAIATHRFSQNLATLRTLANCTTVSMHGAPLSKHNNQDLMQFIDLASHDLLGDAVSTIAPYQPIYLTDTGGRWLAQASNLRDQVGLSWPIEALPNNRLLFRKYVAESDFPLYISTHPERWNSHAFGYVRTKLVDTGVNMVKYLLRCIRTASHK